MNSEIWSIMFVQDWLYLRWFETIVVIIWSWQRQMFSLKRPRPSLAFWNVGPVSLHNRSFNRSADNFFRKHTTQQETILNNNNSIVASQSISGRLEIILLMFYSFILFMLQNRASVNKKLFCHGVSRTGQILRCFPPRQSTLEMFLV